MLPSIDGTPQQKMSWGKVRKPMVLPIRSNLINTYLLPSRSGIIWMLIALLFSMWAANVGNNPTLLLGCFLLAGGMYATLQTISGLYGLKVISWSSEPVFEGDLAPLKLKCESSRRPEGLVVEGKTTFAPVVFQHNNQGVAHILIPTKQRGVFSSPLLRITHRRPFGVALAWFRVFPEGQMLVWPRPEKSGPSCPGDKGAPVYSAYSQQQAKASKDADQWSHLRDYRVGDRVRDIDWKRTARTGAVWVREYEKPPGGDIKVNWEDTEGLDYELRLRRLARWVLEAEKKGRNSELILPHLTIPTNRGNAHRIACLNALAAMPQENT